MTEKMKKLRPREFKSLEEYARTGNHADAYIAAGYKVKSREVARTCGSRLLRRLDENMDYREVLEAVGLTDRRVAEVMRGLVEHPDAKVRVQALNIATRCLGWQKETIDPGAGAEIIIVRRFPDQTQIGQRGEPKVLPSVELKPISIIR